MNIVANGVLVALGLVLAAPSASFAQASASEKPGASRIAVCSLLPKEEVKKHLPWEGFLDGMPIEDEQVGAAGSACNYPSVYVQVLPFSQGTIDFVRGKGGEAVEGIGEEAYFRNNENGYAEVLVKVGGHLLTLQANADDGIDSVKPNVLSLANAFVAKLR